jgi:DNA-directed RNA polymerase II subunit RPB2
VCPDFDEDDDNNVLQEEEQWTVITSYFDEKGLVRQQLDSYDEFLENTVQEVVEESRPIVLYPESDKPPDDPDYEVLNILSLSSHIFSFLS